MKQLILLLTFLLAGTTCFAQLISPLPEDEVQLGPEGRRRLDRHKANRTIDQITFVRVNAGALLREGTCRMLVENKAVSVVLDELDYRDDGNFSRFGKMEQDESGVFFSVVDGQLGSKFYIGSIPYSILPLEGDVHVLLRYNNGIYARDCGVRVTSGPDPHGVHPYEDQPVQPQDLMKTTGPDDNCRLRVLLIVTGQAEPEIPLSLELAARMMEDESNLAYSNSLVGTRMEVARVVRTTYVETTGSTASTEYGSTYSVPNDLLNMRSGAGLLSNIPGLRNTYAADIVVMVRSEATNAAMGFYGVALGVPVDPYALNANNGFAIVSTEYMIGGRFTFAHEIGHIMGARHDNHIASPAYAKGYVYTTSGTTNRTIMAVGCGTVPGTGCRIQYFSNPNLVVGGYTIGTVAGNDNARRINETAPSYLNFRTTSANLLIPAETYDNEILARHIATQTISTNNNAVIAQSGSRASMRAGNSVTLLPGFAANYGSSFIAYVGNCTSAPLFRGSSGSNVAAGEEADRQELSVYPIPANSMVHASMKLEQNGNADLTLTDVTGKVVWSNHVAGQKDRLLETIDTRALTNGVYHLSVSTGKRTVTEKVIVLH